MTTDNKTLADVQPGGRVRLGDGFGPSEVWVNVYSTGAFREANDTRARVGADGVGTVLRYVRDDLSAQPSPGGQGETLVTDAMVMAALQAVTRETLAGVGDCDSKVIGVLTACGIDGAVDIPTMVRAMLEAALAARQPVGEPVAWLVHWSDMPLESPEVTRSASRIAEVSTLTHPPRIVPLYAAPPAQAVDLGQFVPTERPLAYLKVETYHEAIGWNECRRSMLALIDSQAVGNK